MKKVELTIVLLLISSSYVLAASSDSTTRMVAMGIAAAIFYGIIAIVRGIRNKGKDN